MDIDSVPEEVRNATQKKWPKQFLVWQAMDELGNVCRSYVEKGSLGSVKYLEECLRKRLLPFIKKYHPNLNVVIWPDMARIHYSTDVQQWLQTEGIDYVKWEDDYVKCSRRPSDPTHRVFGTNAKEYTR